MRHIFGYAGASALMLLLLTLGFYAGRDSRNNEQWQPTDAELQAEVEHLRRENNRLRLIVEDAGLEDVDPYRYGR